MSAEHFSTGQIASTAEQNERIDALNAEDAALKTRMNTAESAINAEPANRASALATESANRTAAIQTAVAPLQTKTNALTAADAAESTARIGGDNTLGAQMRAGDAEVSATAADAVTRLEQRLDDAQRVATTVSTTLPTTLAAPALAGDTSILVAAGGRFADGQSIVLYNRVTGQIHTTTVDGPPLGNSIPLADAIPANWAASAIGDPVGSSPPEIEYARNPTFRPDDYRGSLPERLTFIEQKQVLVSTYRRKANGNEGLAINMALADAPAWHTVIADAGEFTVPFLSRVQMVSNRRLKLLSGHILRPQVWSMTLSATALANQTYITVGSAAGRSIGEGMAIPLANGKRHFAFITAINVALTQVNIQPAIPSGTSAPNGATVTPSWAAGAGPHGLISAAGITNFEIEGGYVDGVRGSLPHGRMSGLELRGCVNGRIDGFHAANIASNKVDGFNNWGFQGDGILLYKLSGAPYAPLCRNIRINDPFIEHCDRSGIAVAGCDGAYIEKGTIVDIKPTDGSVGNLGVGVVFEDDDIGTRNTGYVKNVDISECYHGLISVASVNTDPDGDGNPFNSFFDNSPESRAVNVLFEGNRLRGQTGYDILLRSAFCAAVRNDILLGAGYGIAVLNATGFDASFNTIRATGVEDVRAGMLFGGSRDGKAIGNTIHGTYTSGMLFDQRFFSSGMPYMENILVALNNLINCVHPSVSDHAPIRVLAGTVNPITGEKLNDADPAGVQSVVARLKIRDNSIMDTRTGTDRTDYGLDFNTVPDSQIATWDVGHNGVSGVQLSAYRAMRVESKVFPAVVATLSFNAPSAGYANAIGTVTVPGATPLYTRVEVVPAGVPPTGYDKPEGFCTTSDNITVRLPVRNGSPATPPTAQYMIVATSYH